MNELIDKLAIQFIFLFLILGLTFLYNYLYSFFYTEQHRFTLKSFYPSKNSPHTIHFFARFFSLLYILGSLHVTIEQNIMSELFYFAFMSIVLFILFSVSLYILDSITLYNFEFDAEIFTKKNYTYALISAGNSIAAGLLVNNIATISFGSLINTIFLWLFSMVLIGFSIKIFSYVFKQSINRHIIQQNLSISFTYAGFIIGNALAIVSCFPKVQLPLEKYSLHVITSSLLLILITSLIFYAIKKIFRIQEDYKGDLLEETDKEPEIGNGIYNGVSYFVSCYVAIIITEHINFGSFYPVINTITQ